MGLKKLALLLRRSSLETRLEILIILKNEAHCVSDLISHTKKSQTAISHHLSILSEAELVTKKKNGKFIEYSLSPTGLRFVDAINSLGN